MPARSPNVRKFVEIPPLGVLGTYVKYKLVELMRPFCFCFLLRHGHSSNGSTDIHTLYLNRRGFTQEGAFGVSHRKKFSSAGTINSPNFQRAFSMQIEKVE
jgi:hypothetical protein